MQNLEAVLNVFIGPNILEVGPDYPALDLFGKLGHPRPFLKPLLQNLSNYAIGLDIFIIVSRSIDKSRAFDRPG